MQSDLPASYLPYSIDMAIDECNNNQRAKNPSLPNCLMCGKQPVIIGKAFGSKVWVHANGLSVGEAAETTSVSRVS